MDHARQVELVKRFFELREAGSTDLAPASYRQPASAYVSPERFARERERLFRGRPLLAGLSGDAAGPGDYFTFDADGVPLVIVRGEDGLLRAMVNVCRHRGARLVEGRGAVYRRTFVCPFHAWTYDANGRLLGQPMAADGFDDIDRDELCLRQWPVVERHGIVFAGGDDEAVDALVRAASFELSPYDFGTYRHIETRSQTRPLNWKLVIDTFTEAYHIFSLHKNTIGPWYFSRPSVFDAMGPIGRLGGIRVSITELGGTPQSEWSLLPHATVLYFVPPNAILVHQLDHVELWQSFAGSRPGECRIETSVYAPPGAAKPDEYYVRNLDLLMDVTNGEDFPQAEQTQAALEAGASDGLVFGRNEPALIHFHRTLEAMLHP
jgi:nitrite reductase/ring-hydroxylating ferredoxin subunit